MIDIPESGFCYWLCGLIDGDGYLCYRANENRRAFANGKIYTFREVTCDVGISLRADDLRTLRFIKYKTGAGTIYRKCNPEKTRSKPLFTWKVSRINDLLNIMIPIFDKGFFATRKREEYELWKDGVNLKYMVAHLPRRTRVEKMWNNEYFSKAVEIAEKIRKIKEYSL